MKPKLITATALAVAAAAIAAHSALAASTPRSPGAPANADPKNEWPFTRPATSPAIHLTINADPKNEWPFTRRVGASTVFITSSSGFSWTDGGIGLAAGIGLALSGGGALVLARKTRYPHAT